MEEKKKRLAKLREQQAGADEAKEAAVGSTNLSSLLADVLGTSGAPGRDAKPCDPRLASNTLIFTIYNVKRPYIAEAPWSEAKSAVALLFVELLQAQPGRQAR